MQADENKVKVQGGSVWMALAEAVSYRLWLGGVVSVKRGLDLIRRRVASVVIITAWRSNCSLARRGGVGYAVLPRLLLVGGRTAVFQSAALPLLSRPNTADDPKGEGRLITLFCGAT